MTSSKKKSGEQLITVDAGKLSLGLKTTFEGVAMVFDSLGADAGFDVMEKDGAAEKKAAVKKKPGAKEDKPAGPVHEEENENEDAQTDGTGDDGASGDGDAIPAADDNVSQVEDEQEKEPDNDTQETKSADASAGGAVSSITLDDVTKIIVQKIKQDRGNNQKIGQILKTYGAAKVGELDPKKYEAFLTDLAAL